MDRETLEQRTIFPQGTLIKTSLDLSLKAAIRPAFVTDGVLVGNIIHNYPFGAATTASNTTTTTTTTTHHHQDDEGSIPRFSNDSVTKHRTAKRERERQPTPVRRPLNSPLLARPSISTVRVIKSERSILQRCDTPCVQLREEVGKAWARKANALERARESRREYIDETRRVRMYV